MPLRMLRRLRLRHWIAIALGMLLLALILWIALAYAGLPRLWSHHEHKRIGGRDAIVSYTAQDIPADPINLRLRGSEAQIACAFAKAGWSRADGVTLRSALMIAASVLRGRPYPAAPVSPLYLDDRVQDLAFQLDEGGSADRRHHVRLWRVGPADWLAAATYDRGVGLSLFTLQITHHIGPDVDAERARAGALIVAGGGRRLGVAASRLAPGVWHRNGGGDRYRTDGLIEAFALGPACGTT